MGILGVIKTKIGEQSSIFKFLRLFYHSWMPETVELNKVLAKYNSFKGEVKFIQIGSNDGKNGDPLYPFITSGKWKGVLVEPVDYLFERLKNTYAEVNSNLQFVNAAVGKFNGEATFYSINKDACTTLPTWVNQLGSFNKNIILNHKNAVPEIESLIVEIKVPVLQFSALITNSGPEKFDLLHVDTEGFDFEILKMVDFNRHHPDIVLYEHKHLSMNDFKESVIYLKSFGYTPFITGGDTAAIKNTILNVVHS